MAQKESTQEGSRHPDSAYLPTRCPPLPRKAPYGTSAPYSNALMLPKLNTYTPDCSFQPLRGNVLRITFLIPNYAPRGPLLRPNSGSPLAEASRGTLWLHLAPRLCSTFSFISKGQTKTLVSIHIHEPPPTLALSTHIHTHTLKWVGGGVL